MKIVTTTGFYGTGSSAITDLLCEYDNICCKGDYEIRIAHDPYGISDLEYNLIENPNRYNSSNSVKKFIAMVDRLHGTFYSKRYEAYFNNKFKIYSEEYLNQIVEFQYYGRWHYDLIERGKTAYFLSRSYNKMFTIIKKIFGIKNDVDHCLLSEKEPAFGTILDSEKFLQATKQYFDKLLNEINTEHKTIIMADQLVPPTNIERYERYFSNLYSIVVDRDPRDIYLLEKYEWKGHTVPYYDIDKFCLWFEWTRRQYEIMPKGRSMLVRFEDLLYKYEDTVKKIEEFLELNPVHHTMKETHLLPQQSMKNTKLWEKYPNDNHEMELIHERLRKYCYDYK